MGGMTLTVSRALRHVRPLPNRRQEFQHEQEKTTCGTHHATIANLQLDRSLWKVDAKIKHYKTELFLNGGTR